MSRELGAAESATEEPDDRPPAPKYTDGGYGWVILASCFVVNGLGTTFVKTFGIFFLDIQEYFDTLAFKVSWITAICEAVFHVGSPLASALSLLLSHRVVIIIGGILCSLGLLLGSFGFSIVAMYLTTGLLIARLPDCGRKPEYPEETHADMGRTAQAPHRHRRKLGIERRISGAVRQQCEPLCHCLGNGFVWIPAVSLVTQYFRERRPLANAIASCGECVFAFIFTPFFQWLVDQMSWRQAMMIIAGIQLHLCVCGALMRPYQPPKKLRVNSPSSSRQYLSGTNPVQKKNLIQLFDLPLLKQPKFICMIFFSLFSLVGFFIPAVYLIPHAQNIGIEHFQAALLMSYWSAGDLFGRLGCGWLANLRLMKSIRLTIILNTILSIAVMLLPVAKSYTLLAVFSCICGFFFGTMLAIIVTVLGDVMRVEKLDSVLGLIMFFRTIGCLVGPPLAGFLVDITGEYGIAFYVAGGGLLTSACFLTLADYLSSREQNSSQDPEKEMVKFSSQCQPLEEVEGKLGADGTTDPMNQVFE